MDDLYGIQEEFTRYFIHEKLGKDLEDLTEKEKLELVKDYVLHLHTELSSILSSTSYKMHRSPMEELIHPNIFEEIVDSVKFSLGLWAVLGRDYNDFSRAFRDKSNVVSWRWKQDRDIEELSSKEVAILDIDGVLAQYPGPMLDFMGRQCESEFKSKEEVKRSVGLLEYEKLKTKYRTSGFKAHLPLVPGAKDFLDYLKSKKIPIILISSRPYEKYLNILSDTLNWSRRTGLEFDALYFNHDKSLKIAQRFPRAKIFVDDNPSFVKDICASCVGEIDNNMRVFLFDPEGSKTVPEGAISVPSFEKIISTLETK